MDRLSPSGSFHLEGILVASDPGRVRVLLDEVVLDVDERDVLHVDLLAAPPFLREHVAKAVRLELRCPTHLLHVGDGSAYEQVVWRRGEPFSLRTRREGDFQGLSKTYLAQEKEFYERYGIAGPTRNEQP